MFNCFYFDCFILSLILLRVKTLLSPEPTKQYQNQKVTKPYYNDLTDDLHEPLDKIKYVITSTQIRHLMKKGIINATVRDGSKDEAVFGDFIPSTFWEKKVLTINLRNQTVLRRRAFINLLKKTGDRVKTKIENDIRTGRRFSNLQDAYEKFELEGDCVGVWSCGTKYVSYSCVRSVCHLMDTDYGPTTTTDTPMISVTEPPTEEDFTEEIETTPKTTLPQITRRPLTTKKRRLSTKRRITRKPTEED